MGILVKGDRSLSPRQRAGATVFGVLCLLAAVASGVMGAQASLPWNTGTSLPTLGVYIIITSFFTWAGARIIINAISKRS